MRNTRIVVYAMRLEALGMRRTRNPQPSGAAAPAADSAADVIAAALADPLDGCRPSNLKYRAVANIITGADWHWWCAVRDAMRARSPKPARSDD